jgi:hypothetical protein
MAWTADPRPTLNQIFPMTEFARLLEELPAGEQLDELETSGIARMQDLLIGKYFNPLNS